MKKSDSSRSKEYPFISSAKDGIILKLHIQPGASRNEIAGVHGNSVKIKLTSQPIEGKANRFLIEFLSKIFGIKKKGISIIYGEKSREKIVKIAGLSIESLEDIFARTLSV